MPLPSHLQASILDHVKTIRGIARRKERLSKEEVSSLETDLRNCVSGVYKTIEKVIEVPVEKIVEKPVEKIVEVEIFLHL